MEHEILEQHSRAPSALAFMARAFIPSPGLAKDGTIPRLVERWAGLRIEPAHLAAFHRATGLPEERGASVLYPHVFGFRLHMALLTHRAFPLPIWNALQIRNRMIRHRLFGPGEALELETRVGGQRVVEKGLEVDLESRLVRGSERVWESEVTYFYRGRFGDARAAASRENTLDVSQAPVAERFRMPVGGGWSFGELTGDYNGIHNWAWYARRFGFRAAFPHPQRVAGTCMARLAGPTSEEQTLELWIKGPVFYGAGVVLRAQPDSAGVDFGLALEGDTRPALVGRWRRATA